MKLISTLMFLLTLALVALMVGLHETIAAPPPGPGDRGALVDVLTRDEQAPLLEARKTLVSAEQALLEASRTREAASAERDAMQDAFEAAFLELSSLELTVQEQENRKRRKDRKAERARKKALDAMTNSVTAAESELKIVRGALAKAQSELEAAEAREREASEVSETLAGEIDTTRALVADLSDDQVRAFQRAVDDALRRGLPLGSALRASGGAPRGARPIERGRGPAGARGASTSAWYEREVAAAGDDPRPRSASARHGGHRPGGPGLAALSGGSRGPASLPSPPRLGLPWRRTEPWTRRTPSSSPRGPSRATTGSFRATRPSTTASPSPASGAGCCRS
jgi:hypothetical protein